MRFALAEALIPLGALSSVGRASRLHREGQRFEPVSAHHIRGLPRQLRVKAGFVHPAASFFRANSAYEEFCFHYADGLRCSNI